MKGGETPPFVIIRIYDITLRLCLCNSGISHLRRSCCIQSFRNLRQPRDNNRGLRTCYTVRLRRKCGMRRKHPVPVMAMIQRFLHHPRNTGIAHCQSTLDISRCRCSTRSTTRCSSCRSHYICCICLYRCNRNNCLYRYTHCIALLLPWAQGSAWVRVSAPVWVRVSALVSAPAWARVS